MSLPAARAAGRALPARWWSGGAPPGDRCSGGDPGAGERASGGVALLWLRAVSWAAAPQACTRRCPTGPQVSAIGVYMWHGQFLSRFRTCLGLSDLFG